MIMIDSPMQIGDLIKLKPRFHETGTFAIVLEVFKAESFGEGGWISFDYLVMTDKGKLHNICESVVAEIHSTIS